MSSPLRTVLVSSIIQLSCVLPAHALPQPGPEMWEETNHQLVFDQEQARLVDVRIGPGVTTGFHYHQYATVYVIVQDTHILNQDFGGAWSEAGSGPYRAPGTFFVRTGYVAEPQYHRVRNVDDKTAHLFAVVNMRKEADETAGPVADESGRDLDNAWFRGHRIVVGPRGTSEMLSYPRHAVLLQYDALPSHVLEMGVAHGFKSAPGAFSWHPGGSRFQIANDSDAEREFIVIEVKD